MAARDEAHAALRAEVAGLRSDFASAVYLVLVLAAGRESAGSAEEACRSVHVASASGGNDGDSVGHDRPISRSNDRDRDEFIVISSDSDEIQRHNRTDSTPVSIKRMCLD